MINNHPDFPNVHYSKICSVDDFRQFIFFNIETVESFQKIKNQEINTRKEELEAELQKKKQEEIELKKVELKNRKTIAVFRIQSWYRVFLSNKKEMERIRQSATYEEKLNALEKVNIKLNNNNEKLLKHNMKVKNSIGNQEKGEQNEEICRQMLEKEIHQFDESFIVTNVAGKAGQMDTKVTHKLFDKLDYRIDWKSHFKKNTVPTTDVDKFEKDASDDSIKLAFLVASTFISKKTNKTCSIKSSGKKTYITKPINEAITYIVGMIVCDFKNFCPEKNNEKKCDKEIDHLNSQIISSHIVFCNMLKYVFDYIRKNAVNYPDKCNAFGYYVVPWKSVTVENIQYVYKFKDDTVTKLLQNVLPESSAERTMQELKMHGCNVVKKGKTFIVTKNGKSAKNWKQAREMFLA